MTSLQTGPSRLGTHLLAIPAATAIIVFLGYSSQWLFRSAYALDPGPPTTAESAVFNVLLACLWWTYFRACTVDPGRFRFDGPSTASDAALRRPRSLSSSSSGSSGSSGSSSHSPGVAMAPGASGSLSSPGPPPADAVRWCKKCNAPKPPRAHHCRHCRRCIPKMDHHCPWTGNCVSMQTFPHFVRFVIYTNASLWMLAYLLGRRFHALYAQRYLPAYLGPSLPQLVHLTILGLVCGATLLALTIMLYNTVQSWMFNTTMIEGWEIERHEAVVERYRSTSADGSWWDEDHDSGNDDNDSEDEDEDRRKAVALRLRVEFPYDLGIFDNMAQAMGTRNVLLWLFPFAAEPRLAAAPHGCRTGLGWQWPENGFNDRPGMWPPPDPDKLRHAAATRGSWRRNPSGGDDEGGELLSSRERPYGTPQEEKAAFQARQEADFRRRKRQPVRRGAPDDDELEQGMDGEPGWTNADGDRLRDYGVDEDAENEDEDVPIATLLRRRGAGAGKAAAGKATASEGTTSKKKQ